MRVFLSYDSKDALFPSWSVPHRTFRGCCANSTWYARTKSGTRPPNKSSLNSNAPARTYRPWQRRKPSAGRDSFPFPFKSKPKVRREACRYASPARDFRLVQLHSHSRTDVLWLCFFAVSKLCIAGFDGYFKMLNPAWEKTLGYSVEELLAEPYIVFVHPGDRDRTIAEAQKLTEGKVTICFENRYRCKDGSYKWLLWNSTPHVDGQRIFAVTRDITELKRTADALQKAEAQYRQLFEAPLMCVITRDDSGSPMIADCNQRFLTTLQYTRDEVIGRPLAQFGTRASTLTRQLLAFSRKQVAQPRVLDLNAVVADVEKMLGRLIGENIDLVTVLKPELASIRADPGQIEQVIMNLAVNARDAMPNGGKLTFETANVMC